MHGRFQEVQLETGTSATGRLLPNDLLLRKVSHLRISDQAGLVDLLVRDVEVGGGGITFRSGRFTLPRHLTPLLRGVILISEATLGGSSRASPPITLFLAGDVRSPSKNRVSTALPLPDGLRPGGRQLRAEGIDPQFALVGQFRQRPRD